MTLPAPWRPFFLLGSGLAAGAVVVWLPPLMTGLGGLALTAVALVEWHATELLFGFAPAVLAGFLLTALPRWTGCHPITAGWFWLLVAIWIAGRAAGLSTLLGHPAFPAALTQSAFVGIIACIVGYHTISTGNGRNYVIVVLLLLLSAGAAIVHLDLGGGEASALGLRSGLASLIGLSIVLGGRIVPALSQAWLARQGKASEIRCAPFIEYPAALAAAMALTAWVVGAPMVLIGSLCAIAAALQIVRLAQWRADRVVAKPDVLAVHIAYAFVPAGFALIAAGSIDRSGVPIDAALHAWATGVVGLMTLAVMASMIRRQTGRPFQSSCLGTAALGLCLIAAITRIGAAFTAHQFDHWMTLAAVLWALAFLLFLIAFGGVLLRPEAAHRDRPLALLRQIKAPDCEPAPMLVEDQELDGRSAYDMGTLSGLVARVDRHAKLMGRMMERLQIDVSGTTCDAITMASIARACFLCRYSEACDTWLANAESSDGPPFCPNRSHFRQMARRQH